MSRTEYHHEDDVVDRWVQDEVDRVRMSSILACSPPASVRLPSMWSIGKAWLREGLMTGRDLVQSIVVALEKLAGRLDCMATQLEGRGSN